MSQVAFDLDLDDGGEPTYTVGELGDAIGGVLRRQFGDGVWVRGEIDGRISFDKNNNAYFDLVDDADGVKAKISVVCFRMVRERLRGMLQRYGLQLQSGMKVRIHGVLDYYSPGGRLSLRMDGLDPRFTLGEIALARQELIARLTAADLYDAQRRLTMPTAPRRIGLVTSKGSAAWHDFADQLSASGYGFDLVVCDVRVQGEWAVEMVSSAITALANSDVECIAVIRGGGSKSELAVFDAPSIAEAVALSRVPVITGLGHQTDRSVADEVAHLSLKTPTACAEFLITSVRRFSERCDAAWASIAAASTSLLSEETRRLDHLRGRIGGRTHAALSNEASRLEHTARSIPVAARISLSSHLAGIERSAGSLGAHARRQLIASALHVDHLATRARLLDPVNTLARGWSITRRADGTMVRSAAELSDGEELVTTVHDGTVRSRVTDSPA